MTKPQPRDPVSVSIDLPANKDQVPGGGTFMSFGYCSPTAATMTAWVTDDDGNNYNGTAVPPIPQDPPYQWGFSFTGIPLNSTVSLTAQAQSGEDIASETISITCVN